jgi:hypothetical protein
MTQGGTEWELQQAENAMIAAGDDPAALAKAQRRHADAIRNMMQGAIVPSFVQLVERVLTEKIDPVSAGISGLRTDVQQLAAETATRLGKLSTDVTALEQRLDNKRVRIEQLEAEVRELKAWREAQGDGGR